MQTKPAMNTWIEGDYCRRAPAEWIHDRGVESALAAIPESSGAYYLSLDIDSLDPSIAPGTDSPEAEGLTFTQAKRLLRGIGSEGELVGLDLVEVNPHLDRAELPQHIAVQLFLEAMAIRKVAPPPPAN